MDAFLPASQIRGLPLLSWVVWVDVDIYRSPIYVINGSVSDAATDIYRGEITVRVRLLLTGSSMEELPGRKAALVARPGTRVHPRCSFGVAGTYARAHGCGCVLSWWCSTDPPVMKAADMLAKVGRNDLLWIFGSSSSSVVVRANHHVPCGMVSWVA